MATSTTSATKTTTGSWILPFVGVLIGFFVLQLANLGFTPLVPLFQKDWGANFGQLGLFLGLGGPLLILLSLPAGEVVKRLGEKTAVLALIAVAIGLIIVGVAPDFLIGLIGRILWGAGYVFVFVGLVSAAALASPTSSKSSMMGIVGAVAGVAAAIGATLVGTIASSSGWRAGFYTLAVLSILGLILFLVLYRRRPTQAHQVQVATGEKESMDSTQEPATAASDAPKLRSPYRTAIAWFLAVGTGLGTMGGIAALFFFPSFLEATYHFSTANAAYAASAGAIAAIVLNLISGYLSDRIGRWLMLGIILALCLLSTLLLAILAAGSVVVGVVFGAFVVGLGLCLPNLNNAIAASLTAGTEGEVGPIIGMLQFITGIGVYAGPQIFGLLVGATGSFVAGWYFVSAAFAVAIILVYYLSTRTKGLQAL
jgi:MFS transporter, ACS family, D-galactonate transporter